MAELSRRRKRPSASREIAVVVCVALLLSWLVKTFAVQAFLIPSESMENTLQVGDRVVVTKWTADDLKRGDVVVFEDPADWLRGSQQPESVLARVTAQVGGLFAWLGLTATAKGHVVKRVMGVPGDSVTCRDAAGPVLVNGVPLAEPYLFPGDTPCTGQPLFEIRVPPGAYWVMGDHRSMSGDSRAHRDEPRTQGFVPQENVVGRAYAVVWPLSHARRLPRSLLGSPLQGSTNPP